MEEPQNLKEHQISKEAQITNKPQVTKHHQFSKETEIVNKP